MGRTAVAVSGLAESGLVHRLTRGRLWIGALTTLLVGIVALNVARAQLQRLREQDRQAGRRAEARDLDPAGQIAKDGASDQRVQAEAANLGLIVPEPGSISYLRPKPSDAAERRQAARLGELTAGSSYAPAATSATPDPIVPTP